MSAWPRKKGYMALRTVEDMVHYDIPQNLLRRGMPHPTPAPDGGRVRVEWLRGAWMDLRAMLRRARDSVRYAVEADT